MKLFMKPSIKSFVFIITSIVLMIPTAIAQKTPFTGTIIFDVKSEGDLPEAAKSLMPKTMTYRFSTNNQSMKLDFALAEQKTIYNPSTSEARIMMNIAGQKIVINQTASELDALRKQQGETIEVKESDETKTIAGYLCKKTMITKKTSEGKENTSNIYYTDAIDVSKFKLFNAFPEVKGFPLEFSMKSGQVEYKVMARSVTRESVPASEFEVGSDYKQMTVAELQKFFGGIGSLGKK
jgi:hypothetical protein